jgi:hypothetical protein
MSIVEQSLNRACHTGERNCFFRNIQGKKKLKPLPFETPSRLEEVIKDRLTQKPENSYTVRLFWEGEDRVLQKFGEEAIETLIALKNSILSDHKALRKRSGLKAHSLRRRGKQKGPGDKRLYSQKGW